MKKIDFKNMKWWEWVIVAFVASLILFPKKIFALITQVSINEGSVPQGQGKRGKFWKGLIKVGLSFLGPIGDGIQEGLNQIWPGGGWG